MMHEANTETSISREPQDHGRTAALPSKPRLVLDAQRRLGRTIAATAEYFGVSRATITRMLAQHKLLAVKVEGRTIITEVSIAAYETALPQATFRAPCAGK